MSSKGIIPDVAYGAQVVAALPAPAGVTNAYVPPNGFTVSSALNFYGSNCSATRFDPQQLNAFESEMLALGAAFYPTGTWNTGSVTNLATLFNAWVANIEFNPTVTSPQNAQIIMYNGGASRFENQDFPWDINAYIDGTVSASDNLFTYVFPAAAEIASGAPNSVAAGTVNSTGGMTLTINKNGSAIGTIVWGATTKVASFTFAAAVTFARGDVLTITSGGSVDGTLANIGVTIAAFRL